MVCSVDRNLPLDMQLNLLEERCLDVLGRGVPHERFIDDLLFDSGLHRCVSDLQNCTDQREAVYATDSRTSWRMHLTESVVARSNVAGQDLRFTLATALVATDCSAV